MQMDYKQCQKVRAATANARHERETRYEGRLPAYLVKMKKENELERQRT